MLYRFLLLTVLVAATACVSGNDKDKIDLIVYGNFVVTMDSAGSVIQDGAVAIDSGQIVGVGPADQIDREFKADQKISANNRIVMPGLVNGHSHAGMTLFRGIADDLSLADWLNDYMFPAEREFADEDFVRLATELACWEMIRGGTTTFVDMYYFPDAISEVVERCGMRALISATVIDHKSPDAGNAEESLEQAIQYFQRWQGRNERITPILGPHANFTLTEDQLKATRALAVKFNLPVSIHVSESPFMNQYSVDNYGETNIKRFESIGFLDGPTIAAHVVWPTDDEILILARNNVGVIHNPNSNMKLASGIAPITKMLDAGIAVGLGTDSVASNNDLDMWEEMSLAALLQKVATLDPESLPAATALSMATIGGAKAIGLEDKIGSIEVGKRADVIQVEIDNVHQIPMYDVVSHLVYATDQQDVTTVIVDGKVLLDNGQLTTINTSRVAAESIRAAATIKQTLAERNRQGT